MNLNKIRLLVIGGVLLIMSCANPNITVYEYVKTVRNDDIFETTIKVVEQYEGTERFDVTTNLIKRKYRSSKCFKTTLKKEALETSFAEFEQNLLSSQYIKQDEFLIDSISVFYGGNAIPKEYSEPDELRRLKKFSKICKLIDVELLKNEKNKNISRGTIYPNVNYAVPDYETALEKVVAILSIHDPSKEIVIIKLLRSNLNGKNVKISDVVYPEKYSGYFYNY